MKNTTLLILTFIGLMSYGQRDWSSIKITSEKLSDNIYVLFGSGGNIGLAIGEENAYLIDDQFDPLSGKILAHVKTLTDKPVKWVLNTHWHGDHAGGNENMANQGAIIIAHENVRKRMSTKQDRGGGRIVEPSPDIALPVITFNDKMTLFLGNGNSMHAMHVNDAHTDGDSYYYFPEDNVLHMGDNFFVGRYPYIDLNSGGDIDGLISNVTMALGIIDDETKIIPGHGRVANKSDLQNYKEVILKLRKRVVKARAAGNSLEQVQKLGLSKEWDATHGQGFINADRIMEFIYKSAD
ncbi:MBL fold metallo-hydrolase [uncultured Croceitalea sp.]|uniref:MBL fold metallo-hydrolase n=1 Tax=uncultured Croceitalea sp. TaxID=1798908 RepID=UPI00374E76D5